jgi:hypothetical protein
MTAISFKKIFHDGDFKNHYDEGLFLVLSLLILVPLGLFLYGVFCLIMCLVEEIYID